MRTRVFPITENYLVPKLKPQQAGQVFGERELEGVMLLPPARHADVEDLRLLKTQAGHSMKLSQV